MIDRIRKLMEYKALSASQFADGIEVPRAILSHIMSERNKPSLEVITKILQQHEDISLEWLLLGKGEMLKKAANQKPPKPATSAEPEPVVQPQEAQALAAGLLAQQGGERQIEKIIIFYTDKRFTAYTPD